MSEPGEFTDARTVRFERLLPAPIERVWEHLTRPDLLATWVANAEVDLRVGGRIVMRMLPKSEAQRGKGYSAINRGVITRCEPPRVLSYTWRWDESPPTDPETEVRFELTPEGNRTRLVLTHTGFAPEWQVPVATGWHVLLDDLRSRLEDREPAPFLPAQAAVTPEYERRAEIRR